MPRRHLGKWRYCSTMLDLDSRLRQVVRFMYQPLYPQRYQLRCPLDRRLDGLQNCCECCGEKKKFLNCRNQTPAVELIAHLSDRDILKKQIINIRSGKFQN
jgi:hypothetical protein